VHAFNPFAHPPALSTTGTLAWVVARPFGILTKAKRAIEFRSSERIQNREIARRSCSGDFSPRVVAVPIAGPHSSEIPSAIEK